MEPDLPHRDHVGLGGKSVKGSLKSHGCHIREWFDKCEYACIYFDMAGLICNKRAFPPQQKTLSRAVHSGEAGKPHLAFFTVGWWVEAVGTEGQHGVSRDRD